MKGDTQNRRKEKDDDCHNKQAIQNAGDEWAGFRLFLKIMASQETIAFVCVAQRNSDRNGGEEATNTERRGKRGPRRWGKSACRGRRVGANERGETKQKDDEEDERKERVREKKKCVRAPARRYLER